MMTANALHTRREKVDVLYCLSAARMTWRASCYAPITGSSGRKNLPLKNLRQAGRRIGMIQFPTEAGLDSWQAVQIPKHFRALASLLACVALITRDSLYLYVSHVSQPDLSRTCTSRCPTSCILREGFGTGTQDYLVSSHLT